MTINCSVGQGIITCYLSLADVALLAGGLLVVLWVGIIIGRLFAHRGNA